MTEPCWLICFARLAADEPRFFGFAEFLTALALMVLAWTTTDARYRFRVRAAPFALQRLTFWLVSAVGVLSLLADLWRAERWFVPVGPLSHSVWQAALAGVLFSTFLLWIWFAFMRPPLFGYMNARRYAEALYSVILRGDGAELAVIADELVGSIEDLVRLAPTEIELQQVDRAKPPKELPRATAYAHDILLAVGDPRFVRALVSSAPRTALELFRQIDRQDRVPAGLHSFFRNFTAEAIADKQSFLYRETEPYEAGVLGELKPLTSAIFSRFAVVRQFDGLLDPRFDVVKAWDAEQLGAFGRLMTMTVALMVKDQGFNDYSRILHAALDHVGYAVRDTHQLDGVESIGLGNDTYMRLDVAAKILSSCVKELSKADLSHTWLRTRRKFGGSGLLDVIARTYVELIFAATSVRRPRFTCWQVQHNTVWSSLFHHGKMPGRAASIVRYRVRRLIYEEAVVRMSEFANYKGAAYISFLLNIHGVISKYPDYARDSKALNYLVTRWLKKNFVTLHATSPDVAEHCLMPEMSYDAQRKRILFTRPSGLGERKLRYTYLQLD